MRPWWRRSRANSTRRRLFDGKGWPGRLRRERADETGAADAAADAGGAGARQGRGGRAQCRWWDGQGEDGRRPDPARDLNRSRGDRPRGGGDPRRHGPGRGQRGAARLPGPGRREDGRDHRGHGGYGRPARDVSVMYDYVIVGAGSAGCVLAARLSEDPDVSVLLLEAGPPDTNENIHVPLGYLQLAGTEVDWGYFTAPEPRCNGRRIPLPRGKVLGGSSSINAMVYIRGNRRDYDEWGISGWAWDDLFPYFLKSEDNERGASQWHGVGGPLAVSDQRSGNAISPAFVDAAVEAGLARNDDFNGTEQDGAGMYQVTQRGGLRASASVAYLHSAMERPNLTVMPYMHVNRVLFEGTRAVGVEATQLGQPQELRAERETILCGGSFNSRQLLMRSGVGPAEHLALREIETLLDQPAVGENLSDHACAYEVWI